MNFKNLFKNDHTLILQKITDIDNAIQELSNTQLSLKNELEKLNTKQKELGYTMESVNDQLGEVLEVEPMVDNTKEFVNALIHIADNIESFYIVTLKDKESQMYTQSSMLWALVQKTLSQQGITKICDENTMYDISINSIIGTEINTNLPKNYITKTVTSGYMYNGNLIKKSNVIVNSRQE